MKRRIVGIILALVLVLSMGLVIAVQTATPALAATLTLYPDGNGTYIDIASQSPDSTYHWDKVDEASADDASTFVYTNADTQEKDAYTLTNHTNQTGTINSVTVYFRFRSSAGTSYNCSCQPFLRLGANETAGTAQQELDGVWTTYSQTLGRPGGGSWSWWDIDNLEVCIGLAHASPGSSRDAECTQVYVVVDYTPNYAPTDIALSNSTVAENAAVNTTVGNFTTTDPNPGDTFTYSLVSGSGSTDNGSFNILNNSLRTSAIFDYETKSSYSIRVRSTDQWGLWVEKQFTITVTNVNEAPTDIALSNSTVAENQPANTVVGNFTTADPDTGNTFTYTLVSGNGSADNGSFNILNRSLRTSASFDYETKNSYSIRVRSTDQGSLWVEKQFTITVTDVNDAPVADSQSGLLVDFCKTLTVTLTGSDPDSDPLTYKISTLPAHGDLYDGTGTGGTKITSVPYVVTDAAHNVTYQPGVNYSVADSFGFKVNDGEFDSTEATVSITVYTPSCHITADPGTEVCAGNNVTLTEDGGEAVSWEWTTNETTQAIEVSSSGTYGVTITDGNGCQSYCEVGITVLPAYGDILEYYRGLEEPYDEVDTLELLMAANDWTADMVPPCFEEPITTLQLLQLAYEWINSP